MTDDIDFILDELDPYFEKYFAIGKSGLEKEVQELIAVWFLDSEVNNGGFNQFYWNSAGEFALEALEGLETIGADKRASILEAANSEFPNGKPSENREKRQQELELIEQSFASKLDGLDSEYYACKEDVVDLLAQYLQNQKCITRG